MRLHLIDPNPHVNLPSVEGVQKGNWFTRRLTREFVILVPRLLVAANANPAKLADAKELRIPTRNIAFHEVLR